MKRVFAIASLDFRLLESNNRFKRVRTYHPVLEAMFDNKVMLVLST